MSRRALITGVRGQDGQHLSRRLLEQGYEVTGLSRSQGTRRDCFPILSSNLQDASQIMQILKDVRPVEIYHLAAMSFVPDCDRQPNAAYSVNTLSTLNLLESIRLVDPSIRFLFSSSCTVFGNPAESPQTEETPVRPRSQYAITKTAAQQLTRCYREAFGLHACSAILYNHESPLRSPSFLPRKVSRAAAQIKLGRREPLQLGNLEGGRDWGFAGDMVRAMHGMLQLQSPEDFVLGSGEFHTIQELLEVAFSHVGLAWQDHVISRPDRLRDEPALPLVADPSQARKKLRWKVEVSFEELIRMMVEADLEREAT